MENNRSLATTLAFAAAIAFVYAAVTHHWLVSADSSINFGVRDVHTCAFTDECKTISNGAFVDQMRSMAGEQYASSAFSPMGWATLVASIIAALALLAAGGIAVAKKRPELKMSPSTLALLAIMGGLITGCVFVATKPGMPGFVGVGLSFWIFGAGSVMGIAGAQMLAKVNRPVDPDLMQDAMNPEHY